MNRKIFRSEKDKVFAGVMGGIAAITGIDSTLIRICAVVLGLIYPHILLFYIAAAIIVPKRSELDSKAVEAEYETVDNQSFDENRSQAEGKIQHEDDEQQKQKMRVIIGGLLLVAGGLMLSKMLVPSYFLRYLWPLLLIFAGGIIIYKARGGSNE